MTKNERLESVLGAEKNKKYKKNTCKRYCKYMWIDKYIYLLTVYITIQGFNSSILVKCSDNSFEKFSKSSVFKYSRFVTVLILSKYVQ